MASMAGGTKTCETNAEKFLMPWSLATFTDIALAGAVVSNPIARKTTSLSGFSRAMLTASSGE